MPWARRACAALLAAPLVLFASSVAALDDVPQSESQALEDELVAQYAAARRNFWSAFGTVDSDVIAYLISPEFQGAPAWPTTRQSFLIVRSEDHLILASNGLSDPFTGSNSAEPGFGAEVYLQSADLAGADFDTIRTSWQFGLIESFAQNVADLGGFNAALDRYGIVSMEFPAPAGTPERWITDRGTVGALINMVDPERAEHTMLASAVQIRIIPMTILLPDETAYVIAGGASARAEISQLLLEQGRGLGSSGSRQSVLD